MKSYSRTIINVFLCWLLGTITACQDDTVHCNSQLIIDQEWYENASTASFQIINAEIVDSNLHVRIESSGCAGDDWIVCLVGSDAVAESNPPQRYARLDLINEELCDAIVRKDYTIDISAMQVDGESFYLNLSGWDGQLLYSY